MNQVSIRNITVEIPSGWHEINKRNLFYLAERFPLVPTYGFSLYVFFHFLNLPSNIRLQWAIARNLILSKKLNRSWKNDATIEFGEENIFEQEIIKEVNRLDNFNWLFEIGSIEKCLMDKFSFRFTKYYGSQERLCNVTAYEFYHSELFLLAFMEQKDEMMLNRLIATIWREKGIETPNDIRISFNEFSLEKRAIKFSKLPKKIKIACLLNYIGMRNCFINSTNAKVIFDKSNTSGTSTQNWHTILMRLAENSAFGNYHETKESYISDVVDYIADLKIREIEAKLKE